MAGGLTVAAYRLISGMSSGAMTVSRFTPRMRGLGFRNPARISAPVNQITAQPVISQKAGRYTRMR
jgi:hypothetical protein